jgi:hypothetical protein
VTELVARIDSLRLLLLAQCHDLASVEATLRAITARIDLLVPASPNYVAAHRRIDELLAQRDELLAAAGLGGG